MEGNSFKKQTPITTKRHSITHITLRILTSKSKPKKKYKKQKKKKLTGHDSLTVCWTPKK